MYFSCIVALRGDMWGFWEIEPEDVELRLQKGHLFGFISLSALEPHQNPQIILKSLEQQLSQHYIATQEDATSAILTSLEATLATAPNLIQTLCVVVHQNNSWHLAGKGQGGIALRRGNSVSHLLSFSNPDTKVLSGPSHPDDRLFLTDLDLQDSDHWTCVKTALSYSENEQIKHFLHKKIDHWASVQLLESATAQPELIAPPLATATPKPSSISKAQKAGVGAVLCVALLFAVAIGLKYTSHRSTPAPLAPTPTLPPRPVSPAPTASPTPVATTQLWIKNPTPDTTPWNSLVATDDYLYTQSPKEKQILRINKRESTVEAYTKSNKLIASMCLTSVRNALYALGAGQIYRVEENSFTDLNVSVSTSILSCTSWANSLYYLSNDIFKLTANNRSFDKPEKWNSAALPEDKKYTSLNINQDIFLSNDTSLARFSKGKPVADFSLEPNIKGPYQITMLTENRVALSSDNTVLVYSLDTKEELSSENLPSTVLSLTSDENYIYALTSAGIHRLAVK